MNTRSLSIFVLLSCLLGGVASARGTSAEGSPEVVEFGAAGTEQTFVFVFIRTGPKDGPNGGLTAEERAAAFEGHFLNMKRMAEEGELLIAGPFAPPSPDRRNRGLFVIDEDALDAGMAIASTDPTTAAGVFVLEGHLFTTADPLRALPAMEKADEQRRLADPEVPDEWAGRRYVLATRPWEEAHAAWAADAPGVPVSGRLHGAGEPDEGTGERGDLLLVWLDAEDTNAAAALLGQTDGWTLHGWYGSKVVQELRERAD